MTGEPETLAGSEATSPPAPIEPAGQAPARFARPGEIITILSVVGIDQLTKLIVRQIVPLHEAINVIPAARPHPRPEYRCCVRPAQCGGVSHKPAIMIAIAAIALIAIAAYGAQLGHERMARLGLSLILGGAFGNLIDRAFVGHVVDFVDVLGHSHFWAFNVADAAITIGAILVLLDMIGLGRHHASHPV